MANTFYGRGNLGADPELRYVTVPGAGQQQQAPVLNLRVFFDRPRPDGQGGYKDKGGFWLDVSYWSSQAPLAAQVLRKGMRVAVEGSLMLNTWQDKETGEEKSALTLQASRVDLDLGRVEQVTLRAKAPAGGEAAAGQGAGQQHYAGPADYGQQGAVPFDDDIPF